MKNKIKTIIVDDEKLARQDLKTILLDFDSVEVVGEAKNTKDAEVLINDLNPELIFLDVQMPGHSGFDLLDKIKKSVQVIFVTAYDEYAIKAFEVNALDYLLKPVNPERLKNSLERLLDKTIANVTTTKNLDYDDSIFVLMNNHYTFVKVSSIISISSSGDYTNLITSSNQKGLVYKTMKEWESRLPERRFVRIHRTAIINVDYIEKIEEWFNYSYKIYMKGMNSPLVMSKRYAYNLKHKLS